MNANITRVPVRELKYLCFTTDVDGEHARRAFASRFGAEPEQTFEYNRVLWVGPVPEDEHESHG